MKKIKQKFFVYLCFLFIISIFSGIYALLIYLGKTDSKIGAFNTVTFIFGIIAFFILGFLAGNTAQKNGLLEGLVAALFVILVTLIINFFVHVPFIARSFVKTASFLSSSALGGIIGVNFRSFLGPAEE
ncbi:MAG: TIGR04086 family membrane protein [Bacilli bacterium]|nr:TIGR04086 family membrane protein [Bacilli bacterium]MDD4077608.1 TIGR04086 family membrane protein [Bacilli bacterium]